MRSKLRAGSLAEELNGLMRCDRQALLARWEALYGRAPPSRTSKALLVRAVAYKMQERVYGGLPASTRRLLVGTATSPPAPSARAGTVLLREWHGITHQVTVLNEGVIYRGKRHRSLSEVARLITGARWSGPAFFGIKSPKPKPP